MRSPQNHFSSLQKLFIMPQITVLDRQNRVVDIIIVSNDLASKLEGVKNASELEFFTVELLEELDRLFLCSVLNNFNLEDKSKDNYWNLNKATFFALNLYPWYQDLTGLISAIKHLRRGGRGLIIQLTSLLYFSIFLDSISFI